MSAEMDKRNFYIDGAWVPPREGQDLAVENPATGEAIATISLGGPADLEAAAGVARRTFDEQSVPSPDERIAMLEKLQSIYERRAEELALTISREMGAPISFTRDYQVTTGLGHIVATLEALRDFAFEGPSPRGGSTVVYEPVGVCALITPWNWPMNQLTAKVLPALATGCTCVFKPSEIAPLSSMLFAEMLDEAGCPSGRFNLVNGDGAGIGSAMAAHPAFDMVSFTGSTRAGISVSQAAAPTVKRVTLELGGKAPMILFADTDLENEMVHGLKPVDLAVWACFSNSGQSCDTAERLLVERPIYEQVIEAAVQFAESEYAAVGDPSSEGPHLGPLVSGAHFEKVQRLIQSGIDEGARLVAGGPGRPERFERGWFVRPTVFADVNNQMTIAREEIFGPVCCIIPFDDDDEAIRIGNDTPYGLYAFVMTGDPARGERVARALRAGAVSVNGGYQDMDAPYGGRKQSGNGREYGVYGMHEFLEMKTITVTNSPHLEGS